MPYTTITLVTTATGTAAGPSGIANLNWTGGRVTTLSALTTASSGDFTIQYTLDDVQRVQSSLVYWANFSTDSFTNLPTSAVAGIHYSASSFNTDGVLAFIPGPVGAVRLNSTSLFGPVTLKVMQGEGG
jgi:hypothetical protein